MRAAFRVLAGLLLMTTVPAFADQPGRGRTGAFEIEFMQFTIDHHFAALRMTELAAAGTGPQRTGAITAAEGSSPTPGFASTTAKASLDDLKSLARRNNRLQREEIAALKRLLRQWYGIDYEPRIRGDARPMIEALERVQPGADFNHRFAESFSSHQDMLFEPLNACITGAELRHFELCRMCRQMWQAQSADIDELRHELERHFGIADFRPFEPRQPFHVSIGRSRGQHGGAEPPAR